MKNFVEDPSGSLVIKIARERDAALRVLEYYAKAQNYVSVDYGSVHIAPIDVDTGKRARAFLKKCARGRRTA